MDQLSKTHSVSRLTSGIVASISNVLVTLPSLLGLRWTLCRVLGTENALL